MSTYQIRLMYALANQGLSCPVTYEAASALRSGTASDSGRTGSRFDFELDKKNRGATGICFLGLSLSGKIYRR